MATTTRHRAGEPVLLDEEELKAAAAAARKLRGALSDRLAVPQSVSLLMDEDPELRVVLPPQVASLLAFMLAELANGKAVSVVPHNAELTTQQAAELLGVSRPFLIGLLDNGTLPFRRVGNRRRVPVADLLRYRQENAARLRVTADELTREAERLGLGYSEESINSG